MQKRKIAAAAAVTTVAAAGMVTGTLFHSPTELMDVSEPVPVVEHVSEEETAALERPREANRLRRWIRSLPPVFRLLVGVPLWGIGWVCLPALSALWSGAGAVLAHFGNWLCLAAVLLAVFAAAIKAAVPSVPLRTLLRPRTILLVLALTLGLGLVDLIVPMVWGEEPPLFQFFWWGGATCLLAALCGSAYRYYGKRFCGKEAELSERTEVERAALRLADGVTPRR
ncbi:hypothetical protein [Dysosmobacter sp.]